MRHGKESLLLSFCLEFINDIHRSTTLGGYSTNLFRLPKCLCEHPGVSRNFNARYQGHGTSPSFSGVQTLRNLCLPAAGKVRQFSLSFISRMCPLFKEICPSWDLSQWLNKWFSDLSFHFPVRVALPKWSLMGSKVPYSCDGLLCCGPHSGCDWDGYPEL